MIAAITRKADRQAFDRYCTGAWLSRQLLRHHPISGSVTECCNGNGDITRVLESAGLVVKTNDIDPLSPSEFCQDVSIRFGWEVLGVSDWSITNPPFDQATEIVSLAYEYSTIGIAMLLRCTWMESTLSGNKAQWLAKYPPTQIISLPRFAFTKSPKTGKFQTDSAPTWWFVWRKDGYKPEKPIVIVPHTDIDGFCRKPIED